MSKHTAEPWAIYPETDGTEWCAVDMKPGLPCRQVIAVFSGENRVANLKRADKAVNAMSGIASAAPGSVAKLVGAADKAKEQLAYMLAQQHEGSEFYAGCGSECPPRVTELLAALAAITVEWGE